MSDEPGQTHFHRDKPLLGLATTEELMREVICRFEMSQYVPNSRETHALAVRRALVLAEMLGGMDAPEREYRTVDGG